MYIRKTVIASAIALVLASTSSVMAEKTPFDDQLPMEAMPMVEVAPDGFFVGAPITNNMTVMIVRVYNNKGENVLNVRSKGEPVELMAAGLPDGKYRYRVKTIYQLDLPVGNGPEFNDEGMIRESGVFSIKNNTIQQPANSLGGEDLSFLDQLSEDALVLIGQTLNLLVPEALAANVNVSSSVPSVFFNDTDITAQTNEWVLRAIQGAPEFELVDLVNNNTVFLFETTNNNSNSIVVDDLGDISWANGGMSFDRSAQTLAIGVDATDSNAFADITISEATPDILFWDESVDTMIDLQLSNDVFRIFGREAGLGAWKTVMSMDVNAPTNSFSINSAGAVTVAGGINSGGTIFTVGNSSTSRAQMSLVDADGSVEIEYGEAGSLLQFERAGFEIVEFDMAAPFASLMLDGNGRLGLGISNPTEAIDMLKTDAAARLKMTSVTSTGNEAPQVVWRRARSAGGSPSGILLNDNIGIFSFRGHDGSSYSGSRALINVTAAQNWAAGAHGTEMVFQTTPNNTSAPAEVMRITNDGKVKINGITLNVPDYVFEEDYELMTLDQLSAYIKENKHLPGVASANEVNTEGLDLAGSQLSVLEKVEELTLYTLQQHEELKQVVALKAENAQLKAAHRELLTAFHSQQEKLDKVDQLEQMVNQLMQSQEGKSVYTSLK